MSKDEKAAETVWNVVRILVSKAMCIADEAIEHRGLKMSKKAGIA
jgi:hypothetical protein